MAPRTAAARPRRPRPPPLLLLAAAAAALLISSSAARQTPPRSAAFLPPPPPPRRRSRRPIPSSPASAGAASAAASASASAASASSSPPPDDRETPSPPERRPGWGCAAVRLNKVFRETHSRREADRLIESGRVTVNGAPVEKRGGYPVVPFVDVVALDGNVVTGWEGMNSIDPPPASDSDSRDGRSYDDGLPPPSPLRLDRFEYVKYWKPAGVTCTTDRSVRGNIIDEISRDGYRPRHRVYPVGRLDRDTSGLILLTSDGRLPNSALRGENKQPKVYDVYVDRPLREEDVRRLRCGVAITTVAQRDGNRAMPLTAKTLPCRAERTGRRSVRMTLVEGRNRQIRKMMDALGYGVVGLHRLRFMGIGLGGLGGPGDWSELDGGEMGVVRRVLGKAARRRER